MMSCAWRRCFRCKTGIPVAKQAFQFEARNHGIMLNSQRDTQQVMTLMEPHTRVNRVGSILILLSNLASNVFTGKLNKTILPCPLGPLCVFAVSLSLCCGSINLELSSILLQGRSRSLHILHISNLIIHFLQHYCSSTQIQARLEPTLIRVWLSSNPHSALS